GAFFFAFACFAVAIIFKSKVGGGLKTNRTYRTHTPYRPRLILRHDTRELLNRKLNNLQLKAPRPHTVCQHMEDDRVSLLQLSYRLAERFDVRYRHPIHPLD